MSDTTHSSWGSRTPVLLAGLAAMLGGYYAASWILEAAVLRGYLGEGASAILEESTPLGGAMAALLVLEARPRGARQFGLLLMMVIPLTFWMKLAEFTAYTVHHVIAKQGSLFVLLPTFSMLALPAFVPAWLKLRRAGVLWRPASNLLPDESIGLFEAVAISLPGLLAAFLAIDLLRVFGWLPIDLYHAFSWTVPYLALSVIVVTIAARPIGARQWTILGGILAAVLIAAALVSAGIAFWAEPAFHEPRRQLGIGWSVWHMPSLFIAVAIALSAREVTHYVAGRHSPWDW